MGPFLVTNVLFSMLAANLSLGPALAVSLQAESRSSSLAPGTDTLTFAASKWIWTATSVANAPRALRKDFTPPFGKSLVAADIIMSFDNAMTVYVHGEPIGEGSGNTRFGRRLRASLLPSYNVFAFNATMSNAGSVAGALIATILLTYSDGTTDTLVTDSSWRVSNTDPAGFADLAFDDTWPVETVLGSYGANPWGTIAIPADPPVVSLTYSH
ncbi:hypothetical protein B0H10DRAFT_510538 [Mycena sp. CBHHK59/15]|nr:hypothetical protein B0H10DRAFT_510538 [Mycena sp. CBHHK59/15]